MNDQANFTLRGRNPDVLTCIANLSNDEVFTPPEFANRMLDTLAEAWAANHGGANIWADKTVKFLDPCTKSGVFLREITSRLTKGLEREIPNLEQRVKTARADRQVQLGQGVCLGSRVAGSGAVPRGSPAPTIHTARHGDPFPCRRRGESAGGFPVDRARSLTSSLGTAGPCPSPLPAALSGPPCSPRIVVIYFAHAPRGAMGRRARR